MEFNKIFEITKNVVKSEKDTAQKFARYVDKNDTKNGPYILANFIQNEPQIHDKILNVLKYREKLENGPQETIQYGLGQPSKNALDNFIKLNLSINESKTHQKNNTPHTTKKELMNKPKGPRKGPR